MRLLYIGNISSKFGKPPTALESIVPMLAKKYDVTCLSGKKNKIRRLLEIGHSLLKHNNFDLVLVDTYSTLNFLYPLFAAVSSKLSRKPLIFILHGGDLPNLHKKRNKLVSFVFRHAELLVSPSVYLSDYFSSAGFKTIVIPNPIDLPLSKFDGKKSISGKKILWVRTLSSHYRPQLAIEVISQLRQRGLDVTLTMVGPEGDYPKPKLFNEVNAEFIHYKGLLKRHEWYELSQSHDIFLNTSNEDNYPSCILEAMSLGMIVVSSNRGDISRMLGEGRGLIINSDSSKDYAQGIASLYKRPSSEISGMSAKAFEFALQHAPEIILPMWEDILANYSRKAA